MYSQKLQLFQWASAILTGITLLMFVGATGKSAQIPLYTWLPDAMAGQHLFLPSSMQQRW
jgi:NADH-quinone oxidoreductase subunit L